jgi:two-component system sensor histidine kinase VicK
MLAVPLTVQDHVIGTLNIDSERPDAFTPDHERVLIIAGGQIAAAIETVRLLHETRDRAAQLAEANASLKALDDLRNKLIYEVSHDLSSPLALIYGYAGLLRDAQLGPVTPDQEEALEIIEQRAKAINRMTKDILSTKPIDYDTLDLGPVDVHQLSRQAVANARFMFQDQGSIFEIDLDESDAIVDGDRDRLIRVFDNLIGNAVKFSPQGGTITVRSRLAPDGTRVLVSVSDQGIGIPADLMPKVFERFFQVNRSFKGVGLGLSIVKIIVEAHQGEVWVESQKGKGSTFTFALPLITITERQTEGGL